MGEAGYDQWRPCTFESNTRKRLGCFSSISLMYCINLSKCLAWMYSRQHVLILITCRLCWLEIDFIYISIKSHFGIHIIYSWPRRIKKICVSCRPIDRCIFICIWVGWAYQTGKNSGHTINYLLLCIACSTSINLALNTFMCLYSYYVSLQFDTVSTAGTGNASIKPPKPGSRYPKSYSTIFQVT